LIQYQKVKEVHAKQEQLVSTLQDRSRLSYMRYRGGVDTLLNALDAIGICLIRNWAWPKPAG
jgi:outer membrane protein TolC